MYLNLSWNNFRSIHGEEGSRSKFEKLMYDLLCLEYPKVRIYKTDSSRGGDGGIDIFADRGGGIDIYQCKFIPDKMESTQWSKIQESFDRAIKTAEKENDKVLTWYLCTPFISNREPLTPKNRWNEFVSKNEKRIAETMEWLDGARIIQKLENPALGDLRIKYFTTGETLSGNAGWTHGDGNLVNSIAAGTAGEGSAKNPVSQPGADIDFQQAKSVRRLSSHLRINWKTRWLYDDRQNVAAAKSANGTNSENAGNNGIAENTGNVGSTGPAGILIQTKE